MNREPPSSVYKYCRKEDYYKYIKHGSISFGTLTKYRSDFEIGSGYADEEEGLSEAFLPGKDFEIEKSYTEHIRALTGGMVNIQNVSFSGFEKSISIKQYVNAYIFSVSNEYDIESHRKWFERQDCNYDCCVKLSYEKLIQAIVRALAPVSFHSGIKSLNVRTVVYEGSSFNISDSISSKLELNFARLFYKPESFKWEKELRFIIEQDPSVKSDVKEPKIVQSQQIADCIEDISFIQR